MSFSFSLRAANVADALALAATKFDEEIVRQPAHAKDRDQALAALASMAAVLDVNPDMDVTLWMNGSLGWNDPDKITSVGYGGGFGQAVRVAHVQV